MSVNKLKQFKEKVTPQGSFKANVLTLMAGTAIAQIITVAISPILTRLFSPSAFGIFGIYLSIVSIVTAVVTLRYDQALILPKENKEAAHLFWASLLSVAAISGLSLILCVLFFKEILLIVNAQELNGWILFLPFSIFFSGIYQTLNSWSTRSKQFKRASISLVTRSVTGSSVQIFSGFANSGFGGLIGGSILGDFLASLTLAFQVKRDDKNILKDGLRRDSISQFARQYSDFPLYSSPQNFLNAISQNIPLLLLAKFFGPAIVGFYAIGIRILQLPMNFVLISLRQVFFQKASEVYNSGGNTYALFKKTTVWLLTTAVIPALIVILFGPKIFGFVLGDSWVVSGEYARWLTIWLYFSFANVPAIIFYQILRKQKTLFLLDSLLLLCRVAALLWGGLILKDPWKTIVLYSLVGAAFNFFFIAAMRQTLRKRQYS